MVISGFGAWDNERERDRDRERQRQRDRETDRQTERQREEQERYENKKPKHYISKVVLYELKTHY